MSSRNPFFDDGDDDDASFGGGGSKSWNDWEDLGKESSGFDRNNDYNTGYQSKQMEIERRKQNMLDSTHRSMGLMYEAEQVGNETASELLHQGEQLRRVDQKLDKMDSDLDTSKRHITSIKSVFGGIVNYFSKPKPKQDPSPEERGPSKLHQYMEKSDQEEQRRRETSDHPALRIRGIGSDNNAESWGSSSGYGGSSSGYGASSTGGFGTQADAGSSGYRQQSETMREFDNQLNTNLDEISTGLGRLKGLALGLNDELETQNDYIDRITTKTERVDDKLTKTDKDVKKILRR